MKFNIDFQDGGFGGLLGLPIRTILALFFLIYKLPRYFLPSVQSVSFSFQEKKRKIDFQDGRHGDQFGSPSGEILAIFYLQVAPILSTKFRVSLPFASGEEAKNRFSR